MLSLQLSATHFHFCAAAIICPRNESHSKVGRLLLYQRSHLWEEAVNSAITDILIKTILCQLARECSNEFLLVKLVISN
jgi:hypothetical protein